jgi:hypothetical protein
MWRILAVLTLFLSGTLVGGGNCPSVRPFLVLGATDIQTANTGVRQAPVLKCRQELLSQHTKMSI